MIARSLLLLSSLVSASAAAQVVYDYDVKTEWVDLGKHDKATLSMTADKQTATVFIDVARAPKDFPPAFRIGPSTLDMVSSKLPDRIVTRVSIRVNGCSIDQPTPGIAGYADPGGATLQRIAGHWQLSIGGGDNAEAYGVTYAFDDKRVTDRDLSWGPGFSETTHYDIKTDPEIWSDCEKPAAAR